MCFWVCSKCQWAHIPQNQIKVNPTTTPEDFSADVKTSAATIQIPFYKGAVLANVDIGSKQSVFTAMLTVGHTADFSQDKWE